MSDGKVSPGVYVTEVGCCSIPACYDSGGFACVGNAGPKSLWPPVKSVTSGCEMTVSIPITTCVRDEQGRLLYTAVGNGGLVSLEDGWHTDIKAQKEVEGEKKPGEDEFLQCIRDWQKDLLASFLPIYKKLMSYGFSFEDASELMGNAWRKTGESLVDPVEDSIAQHFNMCCDLSVTADDDITASSDDAEEWEEDEDEEWEDDDIEDEAPDDFHAPVIAWHKNLDMSSNKSIKQFFEEAAAADHLATERITWTTAPFTPVAGVVYNSSTEPLVLNFNNGAIVPVEETTVPLTIYGNSDMKPLPLSFNGSRNNPVEESKTTVAAVDDFSSIAANMKKLGIKEI